MHGGGAGHCLALLLVLHPGLGRRRPHWLCRYGGVRVGGVTAVLSCAWPQLCRVAAAMSCVRSQCATAAASCVCSQPRCTTTVTSCVWSQPRCVLLQRVAYFLRCAELSVVSAGPGHTAVMSYVESQLCWALLGHQRVQPCLLSVEGPHGWGWHLGGRVPVPTSHPPPSPSHTGLFHLCAAAKDLSPESSETGGG